MTLTITEFPLHQIKPHTANPRRDIGDVTELAASITALGLLEPLVGVRKNAAEVTLIAGHRRLAAAKVAGLTVVPVLLRDDLDTNAKQITAMLVENTQRSDLTPVEEATAYAQLVAFPGFTVSKAAKATGRSAKTVKARVALTTLPEKTLERIHSGQISLNDAETLTEFVGSVRYDEIAKAAGTPNFAWAVQRAREAAKGDAERAILESWAGAHGWAVTSDRHSGGTTVLSADENVKDLPTALGALVGPHVIYLPTWGSAWYVLAPVTDTPATARTGPHVERADWQAEREAREAAAADANTAREVRVAWLIGRCSLLLLTDTERLAMLRLLVVQVLDYIADDSYLLAGVPIPEDDSPEPDLNAWALNLTENEAWRALVVLSFDLGQCGDRSWTGNHAESIHAAIALGYMPSTTELDLIGAP